MDLIYGWPRQKVDHMLRDLNTMVRLRVPHLTHYELNVAGRTDFARHRRDELPSVEQNLEMYRAAWQFLHAASLPLSVMVIAPRRQRVGRSRGIDETRYHVA